MNSADLDVRIRPMVFFDLKDIFSVAQEIGADETSVTYKKFTLQKVFGMSTKEVTVDKARKPIINFGNLYQTSKTQGFDPVDSFSIFVTHKKATMKAMAPINTF